MTKESVLKDVEEIMREEFEDDELEITYETTAADVEEWDSLAHLSLIHEIEAKFKIKFTMGEIQDSKNVGELLDALLKHVEEKK